MSTIRLQGIHGDLPGTPAGELKPGMVTVWNYGYREVIKNVERSKTGKSVTVTFESPYDGHIGKRVLRSNRLVVVD